MILKQVWESTPVLSRVEKALLILSQVLDELTEFGEFNFEA